MVQEAGIETGGLLRVAGAQGWEKETAALGEFHNVSASTSSHTSVVSSSSCSSASTHSCLPPSLSPRLSISLPHPSISLSSFPPVAHPLRAQPAVVATLTRIVFTVTQAKRRQTYAGLARALKRRHSVRTWSPRRSVEGMTPTLPAPTIPPKLSHRQTDSQPASQPARHLSLSLSLSRPQYRHDTLPHLLPPSPTHHRHHQPTSNPSIHPSIPHPTAKPNPRPRRH
jgi:hypothetical protein